MPHIGLKAPLNDSYIGLYRYIYVTVMLAMEWNGLKWSDMGNRAYIIKQTFIAFFKYSPETGINLYKHI